MRKKISYIAFTLLLAVALYNCGNPTVPCGTFVFTGTALPAGGGANINIDFNFNPAACGQNCNCNTICYVQIVRVIDRTTGAFLAPNSDQANRIVTGRPQATLNGWAVDRLAGRVWGYYGRNNDGTFSGTLTTGSNTTTATLRDQPSGWGANTWLDFVSVPVCIDNNAPCTNSLLGYHYWLIIVGSDGHNGDPFHETGVDWNKDSFDASVVEWNNDAAGLAKNNFPAFVRMSN